MYHLFILNDLNCIYRHIEKWSFFVHDCITKLESFIVCLWVFWWMNELDYVKKILHSKILYKKNSATLISEISCLMMKACLIKDIHVSIRMPTNTSMILKALMHDYGYLENKVRAGSPLVLYFTRFMRRYGPTGSRAELPRSGRRVILGGSGGMPPGKALENGLKIVNFRAIFNHKT